MNTHVLFGLCLAAALGTVGCRDDAAAPTAPAAGTGPVLAKHSAALTDIKLKQGKLGLPRPKRISDRYPMGFGRRAIDPNDYVCPPSTPVIDWFIGELDRVFLGEPEIAQVLFFELLTDVIPTLDALFFLTEDTPQYFGYEGEYTHVLLKTERDAKRFWDIRSGGIQMVGLHGTMLLDVDRVALAYQTFFVNDDGSPVGPAQARELALLVRRTLLASETLDRGNHPIYSFNAFAASFGGGLPDKIVMGDGILAGYAAVGFEDVAPQAVYAHEFGHHVQFAHDYFADEVPGATTDAELTRYFELMADAYSAYYLTHKRGAAMNRKRVEQFLQVFFQIGDCGFEDPNHHGTPNQRMAAARLGFRLAAQAQKQGHILTSDQFHDLFVAAYPELVAPDAV